MSTMETAVREYGVRRVPLSILCEGDGKTYIPVYAEWEKVLKIPEGTRVTFVPACCLEPDPVEPDEPLRVAYAVRAVPEK